VVEVVAVRLVVEEVLAQEVSPTLRVRKLRSRRLKVFTVSSVMLNAWIICISFAGAFSMYAPRLNGVLSLSEHVKTSVYYQTL